MDLHTGRSGRSDSTHRPGGRRGAGPRVRRKPGRGARANGKSLLGRAAAVVALAAALGAGLDEFTGGPGAVGPSSDASGALSQGSPASGASQSGALGIPTALDAAAPLPVAQPGAAPTASTGPTGRQHRSPAPTTKRGQASA